jgi:transketolase
MEGISHEACSLAGTLKLGKLICLYDDNNISIDGDTEGWFTDDTVKRFEAYGWQVISNVDGHNAGAIAAAIDQAVADDERPTMICCKTVIGFGAPNKQGTASTHGAPLGDDEIAAARKELGWDSPPFDIPSAIASAWNCQDQGAAAESDWNAAFAAYNAEHPELAAEFARRMAGKLPHGWCKHADKSIAEIDAEGAKLATRQASLRALNAFAPFLPEMAGGSADLTGSNLTKHDASTPISGDDAKGNYVWFGVREFGMTAICNGLRLHGGFIPYSGTFLTFSDYSRNALRMAALMRIQNILVYTHDSIGLDQQRTAEQIADIARGGYVLKDSPGTPDILLIATGSEVELAVSAADALAADGVAARVVSMPSTDVFDAQDAEYRESVLPAAVTARVAIEAGVTEGWWRFVGTAGQVVGLDRFGESAPADELFEHFGFTTDNVVAVAKDVLN